MKKARAHWLCVGWLVAPTVLAAPPARATSVEELVRRADMVFRGKTSAAVMSMEVKTKRFTRSYKIVAWGDARGKDRSLVKILGPAAWRGHGTLKIGDQLKLYDPKSNHVALVGTSMLGSSWMGSHFSNDDLVKETRLARDFTLELTSERSGEVPIGGAGKHFRVTMKPKPSAPVAWGRIDYELWTQGNDVAPTRATYYRRAADTQPQRTITFSDVKKMAGRHVPATMTVKVRAKPGEFTRITYRKLRLDIDIPASKFSEAALRR